MLRESGGRGPYYTGLDTERYYRPLCRSHHAREGRKRSLRNLLAEAFIRGLEVGADDPELAGDGDAMYQAFRDWIDG